MKDLQKNRKRFEKHSPLDASPRNRVKKAFLRGFTSKNINHPLFDASRTEAKRLLVTRRGLEELKRMDPSLNALIKKWVRKKSLSSDEVKKTVDKWIDELKRRTGDARKSYRPPTKVFYHESKSGAVNRPLDLIHVDLADVNRLNPDKRRYRYPFVLVAVDAFTNYCVLVAVKSKSGEDVLNALKNAFSQFGLRKCNSGKNEEKDVPQRGRSCHISLNMQTDRGSEFFNYKVKTVFKE